MKLATTHIREFKRFTDLTITDIPPSARLVLLVGPNGAGKTSLFEAFNYWMITARREYPFDVLYHPKIGSPPKNDWSAMVKHIEITFHDFLGDPRQDTAQARKTFYFRSAYRHEPDFTSDRLDRTPEIILDSQRPTTLISGEARVSDNYRRIVANSVEALFDPSMRDATAGDIVERIVGRVREAMLRVFEDLKLEGPGRPMQGGTFLFSKGTSTNYHYKNLSGGEKAAFDLLLDFVIKTEVFNNTVFCIDEPELHMHTRLQSRLLDELLRQLPPGCQLWLSTHSVGMTRRAMDIYRGDSTEVAFLDFGSFDFDLAVTMRPATIDRAFWKRMFAVALDDLADLVSPREIVFCEGRREGGTGKRNPTFDAAVYRTIFGERHPDTEFVPLGGTHEVNKDSLLLTAVLRLTSPSVKTWSVFDRDDRSGTEIAELAAKGTRVLGRRDLESYLWDDEVLAALCQQEGKPGEVAGLIQEKARLLAALHGSTMPVDDIKAITGTLYNEVKRRLHLVGRGNNAVEFAKHTLAPLLKPSMVVYAELKAAVF